MYQNLLNVVKNYKEYRYKGSGEHKTECSDVDTIRFFAHSLTGGESGKDPRIRENAPYANDPYIINFVNTLNEKKKEYVKYHLDVAEDNFKKLKTLIDNLSENDEGLKDACEEGSKNISPAISAILSPTNACNWFSTNYFKEITSLGGDNPKNGDKVAREFHECFLLLVKCMKSITDKDSEYIIIDKTQLKELDENLHDKNKCITQDDFAKTTLLEDKFPQFKAFADIISKVKQESKKEIIPLVINVFTHTICAIMSKKCTVEFSDLPGKHIFFGIYMTHTRHYSDILQPFGMNVKEVAISM